MSKIQTSILDLMNLTVKELKRINKTLELQVCILIIFRQKIMRFVVGNYG